MAAIKLKGFLGEVPVQDPEYLGSTYAVRSRNMLPWVDYLTPLRKLKYEAALNSASTKTLHREYGLWIAWDERTNVVRSLIPGDTNKALFFSNSTGFKVTSETLATTGTGPYPRASYDVGVPVPTTKPTLGSGGSGAVAYYYVYTYVNSWGQESAPSPPSDRFLAAAGAVPNAALTVTAPAAHGMIPVTHYRVYRTDTFGTNFLFIKESVIGTLTMTDNVLNSAEVLPTQSWSPPPANLEGIVEFNQACMAGFVGNRVYISEPGVPYAWPEEHIYTVPGEIVALGRIANGLVVLTRQQPVLLIGTDPAAMVDVPIRDPFGCVSAESVIQSGDVVVYASFRGLVRVASDGAALLTAQLFEESEWAALNPQTMRAFHWRGHYAAVYERDGVWYAFAINIFVPERGVYYYDGLGDIGAVYEDLASGDLFMTFLGSILKWNAGDPHVVEWRSREYQLPMAEAMRVVAVEAAEYPVQIKVYRDNVLQDFREVSSRETHRLSYPKLGREYSVEVRSGGRVTEVVLGSTAQAIQRARARNE